MVTDDELHHTINLLNKNLDKKEFLKQLSVVAKYINIQKPLLPQAICLNKKGLSLTCFLMTLYNCFEVDESLQKEIDHLEDLEYSVFIR